MGLKPVLKMEPPADRRAAQRETHRVRRAARARSEIAIYYGKQLLISAQLTAASSFSSILSITWAKYSESASDSVLSSIASMGSCLAEGASYSGVKQPYMS